MLRISDYWEFHFQCTPTSPSPRIRGQTSQKRVQKECKSQTGGRRARERYFIRVVTLLDICSCMHRTCTKQPVNSHRWGGAHEALSHLGKLTGEGSHWPRGVYPLVSYSCFTPMPMGLPWLNPVGHKAKQTKDKEKEIVEHEFDQHALHTCVKSVVISCLYK